MTWNEVLKVLKWSEFSVWKMRIASRESDGNLSDEWNIFKPQMFGHELKFFLM